MNTEEKLSTIAENQQKVYDKGRQDERSDFWDAYQRNGTRTNYSSAFYTMHPSYEPVWTDKNFFPKYDMKPTTAYRMFQRFGGTNIKKRLEECGVILDLSGVKSVSGADMVFYEMDFVTELPEVNISNVPGKLVETIRNVPKLTKVDKVILSSKGDQTFQNTFSVLPSLTDIVFEGVIGSSVSFVWSTKLSVASLKSIISCLKDYSTENTGAHTITFADQCKTALEAEGATSPNGNLWTEYVSDLGWVLA